MHCGLSEWRIVCKDGWLAVPMCGYFTRSGNLVSSIGAAIKLSGTKR